MATEKDDLEEFIAECAKEDPISPQWLRLRCSAAKRCAHEAKTQMISR